MTDIRKKLAGKATKLAQERPKQDDHPAAALNDCREGSYYQLDINLIVPDPELPEKQYDPAALAELADSIRQNSLYQPIVVRKNNTGQILLVVGNRRLQAAKMAGLEKIPAIFTEGNAREIALIESLQRETPKPRDEAAVPAPTLKRQGKGDEKHTAAIHTGPLPGGLNTLPAAEPDEMRPAGNADQLEEVRKNQLLAELHHLVNIIDGLITDGK